MKAINKSVAFITKQFNELINKELNSIKKDKMIYLKGYTIGTLKYLDDKMEELFAGGRR